MDYQLQGGIYQFGTAANGPRTRNAAVVPPRNARPFLLSNPLVFVSGATQDAGIVQLEVPIGAVAIVNRISLKCHPQFAGIFPQAYWSMLVDGVAIANGAQQIFADNNQVRNSFFYVPPRFLNVQWSARGPSLMRLSFTVPFGNGNSFYLYAVLQGFTYQENGESPT